MLYKTMILELLQQCPELHDELRQRRMLLATLNLYASRLRDTHLAWEQRLALASPLRDQRQIASEALELALQEVQEHLLTASPPDAPLTLEAAMAFLQRHSPPA